MLVLHITIYHPPFGCKDTTLLTVKKNYGVIDILFRYTLSFKCWSIQNMYTCKLKISTWMLNFICPFLPDQLETTAHKAPPTLQIHFLLIIIRHAYTHTQKKSNKKRAYAAYGAAMQYKWCRINPFLPLSSTQAWWHETDELKLRVNTIKSL